MSCPRRSGAAASATLGSNAGCLSYPKWSQTGQGSDRVVILEDTDGDGAFDKKTVFLDNGVNLSGIEIGFGGVWLCSSPNLVLLKSRTT